MKNDTFQRENDGDISSELVWLYIHLYDAVEILGDRPWQRRLLQNTDNVAYSFNDYKKIAVRAFKNFEEDDWAKAIIDKARKLNPEQ